MLRIADLLTELGPDFVYVDGVASQKYLLLLVDADHHSFFGDFLDGAGFRNGDFNTRLRHRRCNHTNNEKHQHHIYQRSYIDVGDSTLSTPVRSGECHYRRTSSATREAIGWRPTAFSISREK